MPPPLVQELKSVYDDAGIQAHIRALKELRDLEREINRERPRGGPGGGSGGGSGAPAAPRVPREHVQAMRDLREITALARIEFDKLNLANRRGEISNEQFQASVAELRQRVTRDLVAVRERFEDLPRAMQVQYGRSLVALDHFATRAQEVATGQTRLRTRITQGINDALTRLPGGHLLAGAGIGTGAMVAGGVGLAAAAGMAKATSMAVQYEKALSEVRKTTGLSREETARLGEDLLDVSARLGMSEQDLAAIAAQAGQLGISGAQDIVTFTETVAKFSAVSEMTAEDAASALGKIGNAFGIPVTEAARLGSVINELSNTTAASSADIVDALVRIGPAGRDLGLTAEQSAALAASLIEMGIGAERAGTQLRNVFTRMRTEAGAIAETMGVTRAEFESLISEDAYGTLNQYLAALARMPANLRTIKIKEVFGDENLMAISGLVQATEAGADGVARLARNTETAAAAWREGTSLTREYAAALDTASGQWAIFRQNIAAAAVSFGGRFTPILRDGLRWLNELSETTDELAASVERLRGEMEDQRAAYDLVKRYESLEAGSDEWRKVLDELARLYPDYVAGYDAMGRATGVYADELRRATEERLRLTRAETAARLEEIGDRYARTAQALRFARQRQADLEAAQARGETTVFDPSGALRRVPLADVLADVRREAAETEAEMARLAQRVATLFDPATVDAATVADQLGLTEADAEAMVLRLREIALAQKEAAIAADQAAPDGAEPGTVPDDPAAERAVEAARDRLRRLQEEMQIRAAMHKQVADAMREVFRLEDQVRQAREDAAAVGTAAARETLEAVEAQLEAAKEHLDVVRRTAAMAPFEARSMAPESVDLDLGQDLILDLETLDGSLNALRENLARVKEAYDAATDPEVRAALKALIDAHERQIKAIEGVQEGAKEASAALEAMASAGRGLLRLGDALGIVSDSLADVVGSAIDAVDALGDLQRVQQQVKDGTLEGGAATAAQVAGYVGVITSVVATVSSLVSALSGESQKRAEEARRMREALRENARAYREATRALLDAATVGGGVTGEQAEAAKALFAQLLFRALEDLSGATQFEQLFRRGEAADVLQQIKDLGIDFGLDLTDTFEQLTKLFGGDFQKALQVMLLGGAEGKAAELLGPEWEGLLSVIRSLTEGMGGFGASVAGALRQFDLLTQIMGVDVPEAFRQFTQFLLSNVEGMSADLRALIEEAGALDLSTEEGRERLAEIGRMIAQGLISGGAGFLGGLTPEEIEAIVEQFMGASGASSPDGELTRSVQIARSITEIQAAELVALGEEQLYVQRTMSSLMAAAAQSLSDLVYLVGRGSRGADPLINPRPDPIGTVDVRTGAASSAALSNLMAAIAAVQAQRPVPQVLQSLSQAQQSTLVNVGGIRVDVAARDLTEEQIRQVERAVGETLRRRARDPFNPTLR